MEQFLDGSLFVRMVMAGHESLERNRDKVNALNVFPVPDGDTGTNMSMSMTSGVNELRRNPNEPLYRVAEAVSTGLLMGARGNSGVILSQLFRGFSKAVSKQYTVDAQNFAKALQNGVTTAYSAVVKPVEGTILTVAKDAAKAAVQAAGEANATLLSVMEATLYEAERSLKRTPDLLAVLRQAGVVDSGGQGLVYIYKGWLSALRGETTDRIEEVKPVQAQARPNVALTAAAAHGDGDSVYGYCTEFIIRLDRPSADEKATETAVRNALIPHGDSMLVVAADDLVKVHIHAQRPGTVLDKAIGFGALTRIKIDNMTEQHHQLKLMDEPLGSVAEKIAAEEAEQTIQPYGIVAVTAGEGLSEVFQSLGVSGIINGGQTMNPSTEDIVNAVKALHAEHVYVLPNNSNIIMAANQARSVLGDFVTVIPTKSVPQGFSAAIAFDSHATAEKNTEAMLQSLSRVKSGQITQAVRDSHYQDLDIEEHDHMGLFEGQVVAHGKDLELTALGLLEKMVEDDSEVITIYYGDEVTEEQAESFADKAEQKFDHCEVQLLFGGQPLYSYLLSVE